MPLAHELVALFNEYEISNPGKLTQRDYQLFLLAHLIVLDTTNAKFLWKRIPQAIKESPESDQILKLSEVWQIGKALSLCDYAKSFELIHQQMNSLDAESHGDSLMMLTVLNKLLREYHILNMILKAYSQIELSKVKNLLGT